MDYQTLKQLIDSSGATGTDSEIAAVLNFPQIAGTQSRFITARTILAEIANGAAILDKLEGAAPAIPPLKWAMRFLTGETGIDIGHDGTRQNIQMLAAAGVLTSGEAADLLALADCTVSLADQAGFGTVTAGDVSRAQRGPY